ncbi:MAG TPA: hypothetical protein PJ982_00615, partial [Lacipirellulaceae bacterium]|nr:hypothetical protein [Lacipirellulaceae bacterium]
MAVELRVATFQVDATPPIGSPLCLGLVPKAAGVADPLSARGVILLAANQQPVVLVAVDWVGIGNESHDRWRMAIASACKTTPHRVAVHTLHQHDAPGCDLTAEAIAAQAGLHGELMDRQFSLDTVDRVSRAAAAAIPRAREATHVGHGSAEVRQVASNRRILGPDGRVAFQRMSSASAALRELPEGTIDPVVRIVSLWDDESPLVAISYYATHPQSYYRTGKVSADFVGLARNSRESDVQGPTHIHFNGASGNVAAGKYNDGAPERRVELTGRLAAGMKAAWDATRKTPLSELEFSWKSLSIVLPRAEWLQREELEATLRDASTPMITRTLAARELAFLERCEESRPVELSRLRLGVVDMLHLPGELFVEYQLAAQQFSPARFVCVAAYGDYGPGYIGL